MFDLPVILYEPVLQGREGEIKLICQEDGPMRILNIYGEAGIGKTKLLMESKNVLENQFQGLVFYVDLESTSQLSGSLPGRVIDLLYTQSKNHANNPFPQKPEEAASKLVADLNQLAENRRVILMFDTSEAIQDDMDFWSWMEANLVSPLVVQEKVQLIFAGRVPVPWRRYEVRRTVKTKKLEPLEYHTGKTELFLPPDARMVESGTPAYRLVDETVRKANPQLSSEDREAIIQITISYTFGHPALSLAVGSHMALNWLPEKGSEAFQCEMAKTVIAPFIDQIFFKTVDPLWHKILWWISPLTDFDPIFLSRYLNKVLKDEVADKPVSFFATGLTNLRIKHAVIWKLVENEEFHGSIGQIVRRCFEVIRPADVITAYQAAYQTCLELKEEFLADDEITGNEMLERAIHYQTLAAKGN